MAASSNPKPGGKAEWSSYVRKEAIHLIKNAVIQRGELPARNLHGYIGNGSPEARRLIGGTSEGAILEFARKHPEHFNVKNGRVSAASSHKLSDSKHVGGNGENGVPIQTSSANTQPEPSFSNSAQFSSPVKKEPHHGNGKKKSTGYYIHNLSKEYIPPQEQLLVTTGNVVSLSPGFGFISHGNCGTDTAGSIYFDFSSCEFTKTHQEFCDRVFIGQTVSVIARVGRPASAAKWRAISVQIPEMSRQTSVRCEPGHTDVHVDNLTSQGGQTQHYTHRVFASKVVPGKPLLVATGTVDNILFNCGFLRPDFVAHFGDYFENVFFDHSSCDFAKTVCELRDKVFCGQRLSVVAVVGPRSGSAKWRAISVTRVNSVRKTSGESNSESVPVNTSTSQQGSKLKSSSVAKTSGEKSVDSSSSQQESDITSGSVKITSGGSKCKISSVDISTSNQQESDITSGSVKITSNESKCKISSVDISTEKHGSEVESTSVDKASGETNHSKSVSVDTSVSRQGREMTSPTAKSTSGEGNCKSASVNNASTSQRVSEIKSDSVKMTSGEDNHKFGSVDASAIQLGSEIKSNSAGKMAGENNCKSPSVDNSVNQRGNEDKLTATTSARMALGESNCKSVSVDTLNSRQRSEVKSESVQKPSGESNYKSASIDSSTGQQEGDFKSETVSKCNVSSVDTSGDQHRSEVKCSSAEKRSGESNSTKSVLVDTCTSLSRQGREVKITSARKNLGESNCKPAEIDIAISRQENKVKYRSAEMTSGEISCKSASSVDISTGQQGGEVQSQVVKITSKEMNCNSAASVDTSTSQQGGEVKYDSAEKTSGTNNCKSSSVDTSIRQQGSEVKSESIKRPSGESNRKSAAIDSSTTKQGSELKSSSIGKAAGESNCKSAASADISFSQQGSEVKSNIAGKTSGDNNCKSASADTSVRQQESEVKSINVGKTPRESNMSASADTLTSQQGSEIKSKSSRITPGESNCNSPSVEASTNHQGSEFKSNSTEEIPLGCVHGKGKVTNVSTYWGLISCNLASGKIYFNRSNCKIFYRYGSLVDVCPKGTDVEVVFKKATSGEKYPFICVSLKKINKVQNSRECAKKEITENEAKVTENKGKVTENKDKVTENKGNVAESKAKVIDNKAEFQEFPVIEKDKPTPEMKMNKKENAGACGTPVTPKIEKNSKSAPETDKKWANNTEFGSSLAAEETKKNITKYSVSATPFELDIMEDRKAIQEQVPGNSSTVEGECGSHLTYSETSEKYSEASINIAARKITPSFPTRTIPDSKEPNSEHCAANSALAAKRHRHSSASNDESQCACSQFEINDAEKTECLPVEKETNNDVANNETSHGNSFCSLRKHLGSNKDICENALAPKRSCVPGKMHVRVPSWPLGDNHQVESVKLLTDASKKISVEKPSAVLEHSSPITRPEKVSALPPDHSNSNASVVTKRDHADGCSNFPQNDTHQPQDTAGRVEGKLLGGNKNVNAESTITPEVKPEWKPNEVLVEKDSGDINESGASHIEPFSSGSGSPGEGHRRDLDTTESFNEELKDISDPSPDIPQHRKTASSDTYMCDAIEGSVCKESVVSVVGLADESTTALPQQSLAAGELLCFPVALTSTEDSRNNLARTELNATKHVPCQNIDIWKAFVVCTTSTSVTLVKESGEILNIPQQNLMHRGKQLEIGASVLIASLRVTDQSSERLLTHHTLDSTKVKTNVRSGDPDQFVVAKVVSIIQKERDSLVLQDLNGDLLVAGVASVRHANNANNCCDVWHHFLHNDIVRFRLDRGSRVKVHELEVVPGDNQGIPVTSFPPTDNGTPRSCTNESVFGVRGRVCLIDKGLCVIILLSGEACVYDMSDADSPDTGPDTEVFFLGDVVLFDAVRYEGDGKLPYAWTVTKIWAHATLSTIDFPMQRTEAASHTGTVTPSVTVTLPTSAGHTTQTHADIPSVAADLGNMLEAATQTDTTDDCVKLATSATQTNSTGYVICTTQWKGIV